MFIIYLLFAILDQANHDPKSGTPMPDPKIFTDAELFSQCQIRQKIGPNFRAPISKSKTVTE